MSKTKAKSFVLAADFGGTNINLAIFTEEKSPRLVHHIHLNTKELTSAKEAIDKILAKGYIIKKACISAAGPIQDGVCKPVNISWNISVKELLISTKLKEIALINDFQAIGYSLNTLANKDFLVINKGKPREKATKAIIGAGTGLGKSILSYDEGKKAYIPLPSEGGHADFPITNELELELLSYIKRRKSITRVNYEEVLSGRGLESIYYFLRSISKETPLTKEIDEASDKAELISKNRKNDPICSETFKIYSIFYARACKNFALDTMSKSGLYIAGGIAAKNPDIFHSKEFISEFTDANKLDYLLKEIPIYIIKNPLAGMYGAAFVAANLIN